MILKLIWKYKIQRVSMAIWMKIKQEDLPTDIKSYFNAVVLRTVQNQPG